MKENNAETRIVNNDLNGMNNENTIAQNNVSSNNVEQDILDNLLRDTNAAQAPANKVSVGKKVASVVGVGVVGAASAGAGAYAFGHDFGSDSGEERVVESENAVFAADMSAEQDENIHDILTGEESGEELISGEEMEQAAEVAEENVNVVEEEFDLDDEASDLDNEVVSEVNNVNTIESLFEQVDSVAVDADVLVEEAVVDVEQIVEDVVVNVEEATENIIEDAANEVMDAVNVASAEIVEDIVANVEEATEVVIEDAANEVVDAVNVASAEIVEDIVANVEEVTEDIIEDAANEVMDAVNVASAEIVEDIVANVEEATEVVIEDMANEVADAVNVASEQFVDVEQPNINAEEPAEYEDVANVASEELVLSGEESDLDVVESAYDNVNVSLAHVDTADMSFNEAFAAARAEVGSNGVFEWRGGYYGTYLSNEWSEMPEEFKQEFGNHNWAEEFKNGNDVVAFGVEDVDMGIEIDGESISLAHVDTTDMSFNEAFAAARAEVGSNGVFEWRGGYYGTYYGDEWSEKSDEFKQAFGNHNWASEFEAESIAVAEVEFDDDLGCGYFEEENIGCADVECVADSVDSLEQSFLLDNGVIVADVLDEITGDLPGEIIAGNFEVEVAIEDVSFDVQVEDDLYAMDPSLNGVDDLGTDDILVGIDMDSDMMC